MRRGPASWLALVLLILGLGGWKVIAANAPRSRVAGPVQAQTLPPPAAAFVASAPPDEDSGDVPALVPNAPSSPGGDWVLAPDRLPAPAESGDVPPLPVARSASDPGFHPARVLHTDLGASTVTLTCWNPATGRTERIVGRRGRDTVFRLSDPAGLRLPTRGVQDVRAGDLVASRDPKTGRAEFRRVVGTRVRVAPVTVTVGLKDKATGQTEPITCTPEHPFYVQGKGWTDAGALAQGASVVTRAGTPLTVAGLDWHRAEEAGGVPGASPGGTPVYNFEVGGTHTYFVGDTDGGVLVHNSECLNWTFRKPNPEHPPNENVLNKMNSMDLSHPSFDCSDIAGQLQAAANGDGQILQVGRMNGPFIQTPEAAGVRGDFQFHQVFSDGRYVYDPRLSSEAIPKGDWVRLMRQLNPGLPIVGM